jgi:hypothetical protein
MQVGRGFPLQELAVCAGVEVSVAKRFQAFDGIRSRSRKIIASQCGVDRSQNLSDRWMCNHRHQRDEQRKAKKLHSTLVGLSVRHGIPDSYHKNQGRSLMRFGEKSSSLPSKTRSSPGRSFAGSVQPPDFAHCSVYGEAIRRRDCATGQGRQLGRGEGSRVQACHTGGKTERNRRQGRLPERLRRSHLRNSKGSGRNPGPST